MSGPRETRESAEVAGTESVPAPLAPPSFGSAGPPAGESGTPATAEAASGNLRLPPFGLQTPWWAADAEPGEAPSPADPPAETRTEALAEPAATAEPTVPTEPAEPESISPQPADDPAPEDEDEDGDGGSGTLVFGDKPDTAPQDVPSGDATPPPGTLVAGVGVPNVDSRRAVPAKPIVKPSTPRFADTDPDGIPVITLETAKPGAPADENGGADDAAADAVDEQAPVTTRAEPIPIIDADPGQVPEPSEPPEAAPTEPPAPAAAAPAFQTTPAPQTTPALRTEPAAPVEPAADRSTAPVLVPDAILPPGVTPPADSSVPIATAAAKDGARTATQPAMATVITPVYHAEGASPGDGGGPANTGRTGRPGGIFGGTARGTAAGEGWRKPGMIGGGAAAIVLVAVAAFAIATMGSGGDSARKAADEPRASNTPSAAPTPSPVAEPVDIGSERTDPEPLALTEAYPASTVDLGGRRYVRDRSSVNHRCSLAARGAMAQALTRGKCRSVVRVTYLDREKSLAVTSGIVSMPDRAGALKVNRAGDPSTYEWFRGMAGKRSQNIDRAGGYAVSTVRGRYIVYSYATYAGNKQPKPGDVTLKGVAQQFLNFSIRPIDARARG